MIATFQKNSVSQGSNGQHQPSPSVMMEFNAAGDIVLLQKNQHVSVRDAVGWTVKALSGTVWITQDGDVRDIVLEVGQSFVLDRKGSALLSPLATSEISVTRESGRRTASCNRMKLAIMPTLSTTSVSFA